MKANQIKKDILNYIEDLREQAIIWARRGNLGKARYLRSHANRTFYNALKK